MKNDVGNQVLDVFSKDKKFFENVLWNSHPNKYNDQVLGFRENFIYQVCDLNDGSLHDGTAHTKKEIAPFYEWLGERIELCLNLQRKKSNEELKKELATLSEISK